METSMLLKLLILENIVDIPKSTDLSLFKKKKISIIFCKQNSLSLFFILVSILLLLFADIKIASNQNITLKKYSSLELFYLKFFNPGLSFSSSFSYLYFFPLIYMPQIYSKALF